jgi:hypothetical protein
MGPGNKSGESGDGEGCLNRHDRLAADHDVAFVLADDDDVSSASFTRRHGETELGRQGRHTSVLLKPTLQSGGHRAKVRPAPHAKLDVAAALDGGVGAGEACLDHSTRKRRRARLIQAADLNGAPRGELQSARPCPLRRLGDRLEIGRG